MGFIVLFLLRKTFIFSAFCYLDQRLLFLAHIFIDFIPQLPFFLKQT